MRSPSLLALGLLAVLSLAPAQAAGQEESGAPDAACFPECRPGFRCDAGSCVSLCGEACSANELCAPSGSCVSRCNPVCGPGLICLESGLCASGAPPPPPPPAPEAAQSGYYVPSGYGSAQAAAPTAPLEQPPSVDLDRARKQSLRDQWRPTLNLGFGEMARRFGTAPDGLGIYMPGWGLSVGYGWRYHFARFGSVQARGLFSMGRYRDNFMASFGGAEGLQLALNLQLTMRFVAYPFFIGAGPSVGFITNVDLSTEGSFGAVIEIGVLFGGDEQYELCTQGMITSGITSGFILFSVSYGEPASPSP